MARTFNGSNQYLQVDTPIVSGAPLSVSCLFNTNITSGEVAIFWLGDKDVTNVWYGLNVFNGNMGAVQRDSGGTAAANSTIPITTNTWQSAIGIFPSNNSRTIYLEGGNSATDNTSKSAPSLDRTAIGRNADSTPGNVWNGSLAEIGVWNRALTAGEIAALSKGFSPLLFLNGLVMYLPFVRSGDDIAKAFPLSETGAPGVSTHPWIFRPR